MTQSEKRVYLLKALLAEEPRTRKMPVPADEAGQRRLLRALFNTRPPRPASDTFLRVQDEYLQAELAARGITEAAALPVQNGLSLWRGDCTTLRCDAIVNAANSGLTGCWYPNHSCIDNAIHTFAGVQLRRDCAALIERQGCEEPVGQAKITPAYNLPCRYVLHTVGPALACRGAQPTAADCAALASCYRACLQLAAQNGLHSVAFCCISTGVFAFPNRAAAQIAVATVRAFLQTPTSIQQVIFNVFTDTDLEIYRELLG